MVNIYTEIYGCTANQDNIDIMNGLLLRNGYNITNNISSADVIIVGTCVVKERTSTKIKYRLKKFREFYPDKKLIITGCMPEAEYKECVKLFPDASLVNTFHVTEIQGVVKNILDNNKIYLIGKRKEIKLDLPKINKDIATVQIAEGCASNCSFCETKLAKGYITSYPEDLIVKEIKKLKNFNQINITSTDNGAYGIDLGTNLTVLLDNIIKLSGNFKLRIGMMNPEHVLQMLGDLISVYKSDKVIKFLHIPVQSGSDKVLRDMNRNYSVEDFKKIAIKFREKIPGIRISTDIIVGYPTETEEDFNETLNLIKEIKPNMLNISKFAPRPNTKAAKLKMLSTKKIKRRSILLTSMFKNINS